MQLNDKVKSLFPEDPEFNLQMIQDLLDQGQFEDALAHLDQLLSSRPDDIRALFLKADTLAGLSRWDEAILSFNQVLAWDPSRYDIRRRLADYFFSVNRLDEATEGDPPPGGYAPRPGALPGSRECCSASYWHITGQRADPLADRRAEDMQQENEKAVRECLLLANLFIQQQALDKAMETLQRILDYSRTT